MIIYSAKVPLDTHGAWQQEDISLKPLNPEYADIVLSNAEDEEFMVMAEVVGRIEA